MALTAGQASTTSHQQTRNGTKVFRIVVLGEGGVGKSALTLQFVSHNFLEYHDPTIGAFRSSPMPSVLVGACVPPLDMHWQSLMACCWYRVVQCLPRPPTWEAISDRSTDHRFTLRPRLRLSFGFRVWEMVDSLSLPQLPVIPVKALTMATWDLPEVHICRYLLRSKADVNEIEFTAMRDQYMRCGEGFLICYSLTDRRSFEEVAGYRKLIAKVRAADSIPIVLVGNKVDLDDPLHRKVSTEEGQNLAHSMGCPFFETSAALRHFVDDAFHMLVREIRKKQKEAIEGAPACRSKPLSRWRRFKNIFLWIFRRPRYK
ncbi:GTP-binding protein Rit1-like [Homarus americanus]|uniref:GTP-binding protein Rit1-like n=1 Tax=Homarus americanus TaxID=6706 RepID=A0A8J5K439_HOMAM|nr:GTP-binding protein Rit1-like [Homarus americanus]